MGRGGVCARGHTRRVRIPRAAAGVAGLLIMAAALRWVTGSGVIDEVDVLYFVRGVDEYTVRLGRPHFPGYPVYIWAGRLLRVVTGDSLAALHAVAVLSSTLTALPLALVAARLRREGGGTEAESNAAAGVSGVLWLVVPASWITGGEAFSDSLGLLLATWVLWLSAQAFDGSIRAGAAAGLLGGLLLGTRLAYVSLLAPLVLIAWPVARRRPGAGRVAAATLAGLLAGILPWLGWQLVQEGREFVRAGRRHVSHHFNRWGNSIWTDPDPFTRPLRFARTVLLYGLGGWVPGMGLVRGLATAGFVVFTAAGARRLRSAGPMWLAFLAWTIGYALHTGLAHDVGFVRYGLPLAAATCVLAGTGLPRGRAGLVMAGVLVGLLVMVSLPLALERRRRPPPEMQLADFAARLDPGRSALVAPESAEAARIFIADRASRLPLVVAEGADVGRRVEDLERDGRTVYSLAPDSARPEEWLPVARFCRTPLFDSRSAAEIWLYRHQPGALAGPPPACDQSFEVR